MFLVGGFAESPILQHEIRHKFGAKLKVLIPQDVALTVLKGLLAYIGSKLHNLITMSHRTTETPFVF